MLAAAIVIAGWTPAAASGKGAKKPFAVGVLDNLFYSGDETVRRDSLDRAGAVGSRYAFAIFEWRALAPLDPSPSFDPTDPSDPEYRWTTLDDFVRDARARGLEPIVGITSAPTWAEGPNRPSNVPPGAWKPDAKAFGQFASALAERFRGDYSDPEDPYGEFPAVNYFQAWSEANLAARLAPQFAGPGARDPLRPVGAIRYRQMLNAFYDSVKAAAPRAQVITTGASPYGDEPRPKGRRARPMDFWRELLCLEGDKLRPVRCKAKSEFDILAHNPINTSGRPSRKPLDPDDISTANLKTLHKALRKAERKKRLSRKNAPRPLWATELWYRSNPPTPGELNPNKHARYLAETLYLIQRGGAEVGLNLRITDGTEGPDNFVHPLGTGLLYGDGSEKPAADVFRFPFWVERKKRRLELWGLSPRRGKVQLEVKRNGSWKTVKRVRSDGQSTFRVKVRRKGGKAPYRARIGRQTSLRLRG